MGKVKKEKSDVWVIKKKNIKMYLTLIIGVLVGIYNINGRTEKVCKKAAYYCYQVLKHKENKHENRD